MKIPHCGGPGPHRHDFEEMFHLLDGEIEFTFRGEKQVVKAGMTVNIPANAPHFCTNIEGQRARKDRVRFEEIRIIPKDLASQASN